MARSDNTDDHVPTFVESTARLEPLHAKGPQPDAFNFKNAFDAQGNPTLLDRALAKEIAAPKFQGSRRLTANEWE